MNWYSAITTNIDQNYSGNRFFVMQKDNNIFAINENKLTMESIPLARAMGLFLVVGKCFDSEQLQCEKIYNEVIK